MAIIMPGSMTDRDYNQLATDTGVYIHNKYQIDVEYFDNVSVPSIPVTVNKIKRDEVQIIWLHGGQYNSIAPNLARDYPGVIFIIEGDEVPGSIPKNMWFIDRNFGKGMYAIGRLAAKQTQTRKIAYIGGLNLPFSYIEVHAIEQAIRDSGKSVVFIPVWTGDFNNPEIARHTTEKLINEDIDVIIGSLNFGMEGMIDAINQSDRQVWFTSKYTDKSDLSESHYLTSLLLDFNGPIETIIDEVLKGKTSGSYQMDLDKGFLIQYPLKNVKSETYVDFQNTISDLKNGVIQVEKNNSPVAIPIKE